MRCDDTRAGAEAMMKRLAVVVVRLQEYGANRETRKSYIAELLLHNCNDHQFTQKSFCHS